MPRRSPRAVGLTVTEQLDVRGWAYLVAAVTAPFAALWFGEPLPMLALLPVAVVVAAVTVLRPATGPTASLSVSGHQTFEGERLEARLSIEGSGRLAFVSLDLPDALVIESVIGGRQVGGRGLVVPMHGGDSTVVLSLGATRWGTHTVGVASLTIPGPLRLSMRRSESPVSVTLTVLPPPVPVRRVAEPHRTNLHAGDTMSAVRGPGFELAELRAWVDGDTPRSINWRASARSDQLWVTERHADRSGDLVFVVDAVVEPGTESAGVITDLVRIAATIVRAYGARRHRLGLVDLGGHIRWLGLETGPVHEQRLLAALANTQAVRAPVWMGVDRLFQRTLRPPSMAVFVSALLDDEMTGRIFRLARSGLDVVVVAVDPYPRLESPGDRAKAVARRIWRLERQVVLDRMAEAGISVGRWAPGVPVDQTMEEVDRWRRRRGRLPV